MPTNFIKTSLKSSEQAGKVFLVGSGPGDPELLTLKAWRLMQSADVVVYDRLVSDEIMTEVNTDAELIYVGKKTDHHSVPQDQINKILIEKAQLGFTVVRLKGGDPYIFGRGGEEAEELIKAGINFSSVPGITSASGAANYCGIPLTHRDHSHSVTFLTGHLKNDSLDFNWKAFAQPQQTLVIYMGLAALPIICRQLIAHGVDASMPIAVIHRATQKQEQVVCATLADIVAAIETQQLKSPSIIVIGEVVKLREQLHQETECREKKLATLI